MDPEYANIPGVQYVDYKVGHKTHRYAQGVPAVLPKLLTDLKQLRKAAKKAMAAAEAAGDAFTASIYNGSQLAYKIAMNR
jgi:DNA polymerase delta subunit 1